MINASNSFVLVRENPLAWGEKKAKKSSSPRRSDISFEKVTANGHGLRVELIKAQTAVGACVLVGFNPVCDTKKQGNDDSFGKKISKP